MTGAATPVDVTCVAFFRNVNQGQRGHPSSADLLAALADAGGRDAVAFQSNGTVVFTDAPASETAGDIGAALLARSGVERDVFVASLDEIAMVVAAHAVPRMPRGWSSRCTAAACSTSTTRPSQRSRPHGAAA